MQNLKESIKILYCLRPVALFKYHLNYQNDLTNIQYKFVTDNLPKRSKKLKKALPNSKCVQQT